jgi:phenylalanyl-tRNA synthetase beta chain
MPTVILNKKVFEDLVGKVLPIDELKDRISMLGTDLESIEGEEINVEIFPNRPDMLSEQGFARAFSSFIGVKTGLRNYEIKKSGEKIIVDPSVSMRPYTACAIVKGIEFTDERIREIMQTQEKLAKTHGRDRKKSAYGVYPVAQINFPVKYIAKNPNEVKFWPLGFDEEVLASTVTENHPKGKEYAHIAAGWTKYPFFIDAKNKVMCMLPYTNSHDTGKVDENTKDVFIECTGNDLPNVNLALNMFVTMFADMGGEIFSLDIEYQDKTITTPDLTPKRMKLDVEYINNRLGLNLQKQEIIDLLAKMGHGYDKEVLIPAYRADVLDQCDITEDVAIAYGYENFVEEIPNVATIGQEDTLEKFLGKVREILIGFGLLEVKNYHLMTKEDLIDNLRIKGEVIELRNALGEHNHLRNAILPSLLKNLAENQHHEYPQNIVEIGRVFNPGDTETGVTEHESLAITLCHEKVDFTQARQILEGLMSSLGKEWNVKETKHQSYIQGRVGEVYLGKDKIGIIGEVAPEVLEKWEIVVPVVAIELNVEKLL